MDSSGLPQVRRALHPAGPTDSASSRSLGGTRSDRVGSRPSREIHMRKLWTPLRNNEADDAFATKTGRAMFSKALQKEFDKRGVLAWNNTEAQEHHLAVLAERVAALERYGSLTDRLDIVSDSLDQAVDSFQTLADEGLTLESRNLSRVRSYQEALGLFRSAESL